MKRKSPRTTGSATFVTKSSYDLDHYRAQPGNWNVQADQLGKGTFSSQIRSLQYQDLVVYDNKWGAASLIRGESPDDWIMFGGVIGPECAQVSWCGQVASDQLYACTPERQAIEFTLAQDAHDIVILIKLDLLAQVAGDAALERILRAGLIDFRNKGPQLLRCVMANLARLEKSPDLVSHALVAADVRAEILAILELCFQPMSTGGAWLLPRSRREDAVRRALTHARHSGGQSSAWDLAEAAGVSQRTLEIAFVDATGITPGKYLKRLRLNQVRESLAKGSSEVISVTQAALSAGFTHLGRFSADYRQLFGELPSDTLSR